MLEILLVIVGGAVGAPSRFLVDRWVQKHLVAHHPQYIPLGTLVVNVLGSAALGAVIAEGGAVLTTLAGVGFCGAFTTFSTFAAQTDESVREGRPITAAVNVVASVVLCVAAFAITWGLLR
ncbi:MAG: CrcB family protein [Candidatus Nanopelagicales bacterium]|nr:CrcB family protein [Candidatus Nanopelagicales bacterium]MDZ4249592.1 CrcB family protein [Candidatus Nanopelagicales bacterium]MDZ7577605.1 CrcB family protein [Candidatus Nanopelagicales bacterium]